MILENNDTYKIETTKDRLSNLYNRNQFVIRKESFLNIDYVP